MAAYRNIKSIVRQKREPELIEDQFAEVDLNKDYTQIYNFKCIPTVFRTTTTKDVFISRFNLTNECGNFDSIYNISVYGKRLISASICSSNPLIKIIAGNTGTNEMYSSTFSEFTFNQPLPIVLLKNNIYIDVEISGTKDPYFIRLNCIHHKNDILQLLTSSPLVCMYSKEFQLSIINHAIAANIPCVRKEYVKFGGVPPQDDDEYEPEEGEDSVPLPTEDMISVPKKNIISKKNPPPPPKRQVPPVSFEDDGAGASGGGDGEFGDFDENVTEVN